MKHRRIGRRIIGRIFFVAYCNSDSADNADFVAVLFKNLFYNKGCCCLAVCARYAYHFELSVTVAVIIGTHERVSLSRIINDYAVFYSNVTLTYYNCGSSFDSPACIVVSVIFVSLYTNKSA